MSSASPASPAVPPGPPPGRSGASGGAEVSRPAATSGPEVLARAIVGVDVALDAPRRAGVPLGNWRWVVRQRVTSLRDALSTESGTGQDGWLATRGGADFAERTQLLARAGMLAQEVLDSPDVERTRGDVKRLLTDVRRHLARAGQ